MAGGYYRLFQIWFCTTKSDNCLWTSNIKPLTDDILYKQRNATGKHEVNLTEDVIQYLALTEIHKLLNAVGKSIADFPMLPQPLTSYLNLNFNSLITEETSYDTQVMKQTFTYLFSACNEQQRHIFNRLMDSIQNRQGGVFFVHGSVGCGKTSLLKTIISKLRANQQIVMPLASSRITATLLPRTSHSRFKNPIILDDFSLCNISQDSDIVGLTRQTRLIIWDEAPMTHCYALEHLDRSLRDLMRIENVDLSALPFGGITIVFVGDFRQILSVIPYASCANIVASIITKSSLWSRCEVFTLTENIRPGISTSATRNKNVADFANWILKVSDGLFRIPEGTSGDEMKFDMEVPSQYYNLNTANTVDEMVETVFPNLVDNFKCSKYLSQRAILTPTNKNVALVNDTIVDKLPGRMISYYSRDESED